MRFRFWPENFTTLWDIFVNQPYKVRGLKDVRTIIDLGAHLGYSALYFAWKYPEATIYAFEPSPHAFRKLKRNTRFCKRIHCIQAAVSDLVGEQDFFVSRSALGSSLIERKDTRKIRVKTMTLWEIIDSIGSPFIDILKFDVEGAEKNLFVDYPLDKIGCIVGEIHEDLTGKSIFSFVSELFRFNTLEVISLMPQRYSIKVIRQ